MVNHTILNYSKSWQYLAILLLSWISSSWATEIPAIDVQITGVTKTVSEKLIAGTSLYSQRNSKNLTEHRLKTLHQRAVDEIKNGLESYGYYHPVVEGTLQKSDTGWSADYKIETGLQIKLNQVTVTVEGEAKHDAEFLLFLKDFPLKKDGLFDHQSYELAKLSLYNLAIERGYFDGQFLKNEVTVRPELNSANVILHFDSGNRYRFGSITYPDTVVRRLLLIHLMPFEEGDLYSATKVLEYRDELYETLYFSEVQVRPEIAQRADGKVPVTVKLKADEKHLYRAGLGFSTDSGPRVTLGWTNRYFTSRGLKLDTDLRLATRLQTLDINLQLPFVTEKIITTGTHLELKNEVTDDNDATSVALSGYYKTKRWGWDEVGSIRMLNEKFNVSVDDGHSLMLIPEFGWSQIWSKDKVFTRRGGRVSFLFSGASESLLSDVSFLQSVVNGKYIHSLTEDGRFLTRLRLGATATNNFDDLPSSLRFFAGGDNSIRGFDYKSLGPVGPDGKVIGGSYLAVGSVEYDHMFWNNWGGAIFTDFGNAFDDISDDMEYSAGVGLRWRSIIGLVRVDIAAGLSDPDNPVRLHLVIGPDL